MSTARSGAVRGLVIMVVPCAMEIHGEIAVRSELPRRFLPDIGSFSHHSFNYGQRAGLESIAPQEESREVPIVDQVLKREFSVTDLLYMKLG